MSKYVFITGGTKGIGKAVADCLAKSGYHLILTYSADQKTAVNTQQELQVKYGISVSVIQPTIRIFRRLIQLPLIWRKRICIWMP